MGDKWRDVGQGGRVLEGFIDALLGGGGDTGGLIGDTRVVQDTETGEYNEVYRGWRQTTAEAIEKGQFKKKKKPQRELAGA